LGTPTAVAAPLQVPTRATVARPPPSRRSPRFATTSARPVQSRIQRASTVATSFATA
jgi:hypothetical protein